MLVLRRRLPFSLLWIQAFRASSCSGNDIASPDDLASDLVDWLRANGAYINEKVTVSHVTPDDRSSPRGLFAAEALAPGETVCAIPPELILKPAKRLEEGETWSQCGTIKEVERAMRAGTPYGKYLLAQPKSYTPGFWSEGGRDYLKTMMRSEWAEEVTAYDELPPHGVDELIEDYKDCDGDFNDEIFRHATMLVVARADYHFMVPFYETKLVCIECCSFPFFASPLTSLTSVLPDMGNHDNGKYNTPHKYDPYKGKGEAVYENGHEMVASEVIPAGGQIYYSYNRCNYCQEIYDWFGTPEMFLHFGFVEAMPQRWLIDFARIKFELDWRDESAGEAEVRFLVPPSARGVALLREELARLESFEEEYGKVDPEAEGVPRSEWDSLWRYYDALTFALSSAMGSNATLVDDVWDLDDDWWVQEGTVRAKDDGEHMVYPRRSGTEAKSEL
ncbi:hypothetical protein ACHAWF_008739 [Thalassiosira exigua]